MDSLRSPVGTNRLLARRELTELWGRGNLDFVDEAYAERVNHRTNRVGGGSVLDREAIKRRYSEWTDAFPDLSVEVVEEAADRDIVMQHVVLSGTHSGPFRGLPATGKRVAIDGFTLRRFRDGKVVAATTMVDELALLGQLGVDLPVET